MSSFKISQTDNRIYIYLDETPSASIIRTLGSSGWKPHNKQKKIWWSPNNYASLKFAKKMCQNSTSSIEEPIHNDNKSTTIATKQAKSKKCGPSATWTILSSGTLIISGSGAISGYGYDQLNRSPLYHRRNDVKQIVIEPGITSIGKRAFYSFHNLVEVHLPDSIVSIGERAFSQCNKLHTIRISGKLNTIGKQAFRDCTALQEIHLPETVKSIGPECFMNWTETQKIYKVEKNEQTGKFSVLVYSPDYFSTCSTPEIYFEDFVTITDNTYCTQNNHLFEDIQARINVLQRNGELRTITIPAGYCKNCNQYFIRTSQFENLRKLGVLLCRMVHEKHITNNISRNFYDDLSPESVMKQYGYSVSSKDDLTDTQRKQLLIYLMESNVFSRQKIINHLTWLIQQARKRTDMISAVSKWTYDRSFAESYKMGSAKVVAIRSLKIKHYTKS